MEHFHEKKEKNNKEQQKQKVFDFKKISRKTNRGKKEKNNQQRI